MWCGTPAYSDTGYMIYTRTRWTNINLVWGTSWDEHGIADELDKCVTDDAMVVMETLP